MAKKPTYKILEQRLKVLEKEAAWRNRVEEELLECEEKYHTLFQNPVLPEPLASVGISSRTCTRRISKEDIKRRS